MGYENAQQEDVQNNTYQVLHHCSRRCKCPSHRLPQLLYLLNLHTALRATFVDRDGGSAIGVFDLPLKQRCCAHSSISQSVLTLVLKFPVTTALLYGQEVHCNYERGANFSSYKTYQWVDTPTAAPISNPVSAPKADTGGPPNLPALPNLPTPRPIPLGGLPCFPGGASDIRDNVSEDQLIN